MSASTELECMQMQPYMFARMDLGPYSLHVYSAPESFALQTWEQRRAVPRQPVNVLHWSDFKSNQTDCLGVCSREAHRSNSHLSPVAVEMSGPGSSIMRPVRCIDEIYWHAPECPSFRNKVWIFCRFSQRTAAVRPNVQMCPSRNRVSNWPLPIWCALSRSR